MNMENDLFEIDEERIIALRRKLHQWPETGFDLPRTLELVKTELERIGVPYTTEFGRSSVVAIINGDKAEFTIGLRADMDALNIHEKNDLPYRSRIDGQMHACGHDAHTAMLLGTANALNKMKDRLDCRVMLLFQPSEEGPESGAKEMIKSGVLADIDVLAALHIDNDIPVGTMSTRAGASQANNRTFEIEVFGKSAHAARPHTGVDAIALMVRIYTAVYLMLSREVDPMEFRVLNIGKFEGGTAVNNCPNYAKIGGTLRTFDCEVDSFIGKRMEEIATCMASDVGAKAKINIIKNQPPLITNPRVTNAMVASARKIVGEDNVILLDKPRLGSEDFSLFAGIKPAAYFRLGTGCEEEGIINPIHRDDFNLDERALKYGVQTLVQFIVDNMNGIDL